MIRRAFCLSLACALFCSAATAAEWGLKEGSPKLQSAGPLTFGPEGILLVGDAKAATVFAIDTGDAKGTPEKVSLNIPELGQKLANLLGTSPQDTEIADLAVNPHSGNVYLSVRAGDQTALVRIHANGEFEKLGLEKVPYSKIELPNAPKDEVVGEGRRRRNLRNESITDLAYNEGQVLISGLSAGESPSNVRTIAFPFIQADPGSSIEIYHAAHGRYEDYSAIRTFVPFNIGGEPSLLAGFTCTPLVKFPLPELKPGEKVRGTTVAELGNRNRPLDMIVYKKDGKSWLLMANSSRGVMKISTEDIERDSGLTERVGGGGTAGQKYATIEELQGVQQLDKLDESRAVILTQNESGTIDLQTIMLP